MRARGAAALIAALLAAACSQPAAGAEPVRLTAAFGPDATLGAPSPVHIGVHINRRQIRSPVTEIELRYPASLGITTSGLGLDICTLEPDDFRAVVIGTTGLAGCPRNAVMATGEALGAIRLGSLLRREEGVITVLAGPLDRGGLNLVTLVEGVNPIGALLAYAGAAQPAPPPYGGGLTIQIPPLPAEWGATIALIDLRLSIGARDIIYRTRPRDRTTSYRPEGIVLPSTCPRRGFQFFASFRFESGRHETTTVVAPCPTPQSPRLPTATHDGASAIAGPAGR